LTIDTLPQAYDVCIVGGGPAGLATAIMLAKEQRHVLLLARDEGHTDKIGESLSPAANPILKQLGVWDAFSAGGHRPCYGNQSAWGGAQLAYYDFIHDPNGHGWHIHRRLFERQLVEQANALGVHRIVSASLRAARWLDGAWQLELDAVSTTLTARFVVDASGRASWFARRQGARRFVEDRQVALVAFLQATSEPLEDSTSLVETVPDGWWYSALLPDGRLATTLMTAPDLHERRWATSEAGWYTLLNKSHYTANRIQAHGYRLAARPYFVAADSGRLDCFYGEGWLAVGDAAMSYDPLAAHGLTLALAGGRDAALAITTYLDGDDDALARYAVRLEQAYSQYAAMRATYYRAETRWPGAAYWQRRHRLTAAPA
jgi:2-polyprenyl-6-methoxyphenol hydroxylase-like FAD-dependent oxidoreductase